MFDLGTIQINNLSFKYDQMVDNLFNNINLSIDESWKLGLIGRNGRGKTTLLNILLGNLEYQGQVVSNLNFHYYPQPVPDMSKTTKEIVLEISGLADYDIWRVETELEKLQVSLDILDQQFETLSPGERTKVLLAVLFIDDDGFQLIDEPTNHLDIDGRKLVSDYLKTKKGFIVISHDRNFLNKIIDHVISINRNDIDVYKGNFDTWEHEKNLQDTYEADQKRQLTKDINKLHDSAVKKENWSRQTEKGKKKNISMDKHANLDKGFIGAKSAKMMKKAKSMQHRVDDSLNTKKTLLKNIEIDDPISLNYAEISHLKNLIEVNDLLLKNRNVETPKVSFKLPRNHVLALMGRNGIGKTTIFKQILGIAQPFECSGSIVVPSSVKISYLAQEYDLHGTIRELAERKQVEPEMVFSNLRKLGFERELFDNNIEEMSQGQKRKVALAVSLSEQANLYLWDEPFNYLDVITRDQIVDAIHKQHPTMLIIDHDLGLIDEIADQKLILKK
ncbi:ribosomal protection-like ABC-F family protein [Companilactobacillus mishanensis]|uniref:ribosomal protection-like ABC-F family protein n=1 Tax=Companilactobacillus mishanensis TaxID=2486008 RepID=UPI0030B85E68